MKYRVLFRVDSGKHIGLGHLIRCLSIAKALDPSRFEVTFACRKHVESNYSFFFTNTPFSLIELSSSSINASIGSLAYNSWLGVSELEDFEETFLRLENFEQKFDFIVIDHYALGLKWEQKAINFTKKLIAIDDLGNRKHVAHCVIDPNFGSFEDKFKGSVEDYTKLYLGAKYSILKEGFSLVREKSVNSNLEKKLEKVLINLGGSGDLSRLEILIDSLKRTRFKGHFVVLVNNKKFVDNRNRFEKDERFSFVDFIDDMVPFLSEFDLVIGAAGGSFWERGCLGVPSVLLKVAENQNVVTDSLKNRFPELVFDNINQMCSEIGKVISSFKNIEYKQKVVRSISSLVTGLGLANIVTEVFSQEVFRLREAKVEDALVVYGWQSFPGMRKYFRNPEIPKLEEHLSWFKDSVEKIEKRSVFIFETTYGLPLGVVRYDIENSNVAEVSILINPFFHRNSLGARALIALANQQKKMSFKAYVESENVASKKAFLRAGYTQIGERSFYLGSRE
ncbi:MAG: UDP-2,4-diacetamido-2,4,6-trideoxy-beta-L-altropyranose hydrolase [Halobacteriovoraceae bacterium]|nr:UDP-2,4-diacetamido-2,4,6-trideoxy-beta-L-altropyranose hydrolase [Halobacteriovoraceae bacterium]